MAIDKRINGMGKPPKTNKQAGLTSKGQIPKQYQQPPKPEEAAKLNKSTVIINQGGNGGQGEGGGGLDVVAHDATLTGDGTASNPLSAVLTGLVPKRSTGTITNLNTVTDFGVYTCANNATGLPASYSSPETQLANLILLHIPAASGTDAAATQKLYPLVTSSQTYPRFYPEFTRYKVNGAWGMWQYEFKTIQQMWSASSLYSGENYSRLFRCYLSYMYQLTPLVVTFDLAMALSGANSQKYSSFKQRVTALLKMDGSSYSNLVFVIKTDGIAWFDTNVTTAKIGVYSYIQSPSGSYFDVLLHLTLPSSMYSSSYYPLIEVSNFRLSPLLQTNSQTYAAQVFPLCLEFQQQTGSTPPSSTGYTESDAIISV